MRYGLQHQQPREGSSVSKIPRNPAWCSICINPDHFYGAHDGPCEAHRGPNGQPVPYEGDNVYEPSEWVLRVVGGRYTAHDAYSRIQQVFICTGYDPRHGFWMKADESDGLVNAYETMFQSPHDADIPPPPPGIAVEQPRGALNEGETLGEEPDDYNVQFLRRQSVLSVIHSFTPKPTPH